MLCIISTKFGRRWQCKITNNNLIGPVANGLARSYKLYGIVDRHGIGNS